LIMPRIFACLAIGQVFVLAGTFVLGTVSPGFAGLRDRHIVLAVFTLLLTCLVQVIGFTYLTVTGKMMAQAVHLARLPVEFIRLVRGIKKRFTRLVAVTVLTCVLAAATGGNRWRAGPDGWVHGSAAVLQVVALGAVLLREYGLIVENAALVRQLLTAYNDYRGKVHLAADSALPTAADPLAVGLQATSDQSGFV
jgi:hypothetical protein